LMRKERFWKLK